MLAEKPQLGFGLGLRTAHYAEIIEDKPPIDWFEIITENYLIPGGKHLYCLDKIRADYPLAMHGVSLSVGGTDALNLEYLKQIKQLANRIETIWISDHLCWTGIQGHNSHDLLPLPYTEECIQHVVSRIQQVQDFLGQRILIENVSSYLTYKQSHLTEWEFLREIAQRADCYILLDVNNVYVSSVNHSFDALEYISYLPCERVYQIHLAGHSDMGSHIIDTHDQEIANPVWDLYGQTVRILGNVSTSIERDGHIPDLSALMTELNHAKKIAASALSSVVYG